MNVRTKLDKLEQRAKHRHDELRLPDGADHCYNIEHVLSAIDAAVCQEEHWLLPHLRRAEPKTALSNLVRMLEGSLDDSTG
jgi:hypothetical protein